MDGLLLPMILLAGGDKPDQKALFTHILPAMVPGSASQRLLIATLAAKKEIKAHAETELGLLKEAVKAARFDSAEKLKGFPALEAAFNRLTPAAKTAVFATAADDSKSPGTPR